MVDFDDTRRERTGAFHKLCLLLMVLGVWDETKLIDVRSNRVRTWYIDRKHQQDKVNAMKTVGG